VLIADTRQPHADASRIGDYLHNNRADGMIVLDGSLSADFFSRPGRSTPPVVFCCEWNDGAKLPSVRCDNAVGAELAVRHLHQQGHRRIGHILGPHDNVLTHERLRGTEAALEALGLLLRPDWIFEGDFSLAAGARAARTWLDLAERPTAVTCSNDEMACGFIAELHRNGLAVPADVSVVGFDDIDIAAQFIPALTTVHQPRIEIGETAAAALIGLIRNGKVGQELATGATVLDVELIVRSSTRAIS
jgi:LacI family repressor for deo operon, udp, cdd, tsx, nupC, and nupG